MTTHIALLRGINIGGHKQVAMADLRDLLTALGFADVRSLLQSGNLVFRARARTGGQLERMLETETEKRLALQTSFFVRTAEEWKAIVGHNPFREEAERDPAHLAVMFLKATPNASDVKALQAAITGPEVVRAGGRQAYVTYPNGFALSRLTNILIEKKLGTRCTGRNWNTVLRIAALAGV
ncbi:MAG: hypothetical protein A2Y78_03010 [Acidobacteria bacterium RBG_13_68_16]|nr:MAG: hypothetical protein A2Y78_03010 [Acidobacteria bacterium RBG_13_68_16]